MSRAALKLAGFAAALALVFATATAVGHAFGPLRDSDPDAASEHGEMGEMEGGAHAEEGARGAVQAVRGLAVDEGGLTLRLDAATAPAGRAAPLRFRIVEADGAAVTDFDVQHTKRMHVIVVRRDLFGFRHLHPTMSADGEWSVPLRLTEPGTYRVFADFSDDGTPRTLATDLQVDGPVRSQPLPAPAPIATVDGYAVRLESGVARAGEEAELSFAVSRSGREVALQDYLGAKGHLVALREGDLAFLHVHPDEDRLRFMATFPSAGRYRLFLQFKTGGEVQTAPFTLEISR